ncbi:hypothetical protein GH714_039104 [Hevea brasiliensis]|uniref:Major facilitator superfamily (MFS) profile domain-containing protein n=1 Tax=Hevea brasiliensis TaxID=3981 RepID=A0A6A6KB68_HEVBR|nr:hypothetical protein GH714_039104 [Hevea brasiliensis]
MAGGGFTDTGNLKRAHLYEYRITGHFIFACVIAASGGSLFGYDLGVSGGVTSMDDFLKEFFPTVYEKKHAHLHETDYCKYDNQILTLFTSSLYFAALVATFGASYVTRTRGRKASILVGSTSFFIGAIVNAFAKNIAMLIIGRCFLGGGIGFGNQAVPLYLSEMAPAKIRGAVNQLFQLTTCLGILAANFINYGTEKIHPWGWRLSLGLATVPATIMFAGGIFLPETPNSLIEQGRLEEGRRILEKVRGTTQVDAEFDDLVDASNAARAIKHPFKNLLKRKNRPQLVIGALGIPAFQQLTGNNSILFYAPVIFQSLGFSNDAALFSSVITNAALVVGALMSMAFVDKFGRRAFFLEAGAEMFIVMVAVGITLALDFGDGKPIPKELASSLWLSYVCLSWLTDGPGASRLASSERDLPLGDKEEVIFNDKRVIPVLVGSQCLFWSLLPSGNDLIYDKSRFPILQSSTKSLVVRNPLTVDPSSFSKSSILDGVVVKDAVSSGGSGYVSHDIGSQRNSGNTEGDFASEDEDVDNPIELAVDDDGDSDDFVEEDLDNPIELVVDRNVSDFSSGNAMYSNGNSTLESIKSQKSNSIMEFSSKGKHDLSLDQDGKSNHEISTDNNLPQKELGHIIIAFKSPLIEPEVVSSSTNIIHPRSNGSSSVGSAIQKNDYATSKNNSAKMNNPSRKKMKCEMPPKSITLIDEMNRILVRHRRSSRSMRPRWSSHRDQEILAVRSQIENAPVLVNDRDLYAPLFQNVSKFKRDINELRYLDSAHKIFKFNSVLILAELELK